MFHQSDSRLRTKRIADWRRGPSSGLTTAVPGVPVSTGQQFCSQLWFWNQVMLRRQQLLFLRQQAVRRHAASDAQDVLPGPQRGLPLTLKGLIASGRSRWSYRQKGTRSLPVTITGSPHFRPIGGETCQFQVKVPTGSCQYPMAEHGFVFTKTSTLRPGLSVERAGLSPGCSPA